MNKFAMFVLSVSLLFGFIPAASAQDDIETSSTQTSAEPVTKTLRITKYAWNVNRPCPEGSDKMFIVKVFVHPDSLGTFADGNAGVGEIVLRSDRQINTDDYQVPPDFQEADFFFYAPNRTAKVKKDRRENSVTVEISGPNMWFRVTKLRADCLEHFGS